MLIYITMTQDANLKWFHIRFTRSPMKIFRNKFKYAAIFLFVTIMFKFTPMFHKFWLWSVEP
jgi:hypothetical protein